MSLACSSAACMARSASLRALEGGEDQARPVLASTASLRSASFGLVPPPSLQDKKEKQPGGLDPKLIASWNVHSHS